MGVLHRSNRGKWGYQKYYHGKRYERYAWDKRAEAERAFKDFLATLRLVKKIPSNSFLTAFNQFIAESAVRGRSVWRLDALRYTFRRFVLPFFGPTRSIATVTAKDVEKFVAKQRDREVTNNTIWHYITDIRAFFNWAIDEGIAVTNPVKKADLRSIRNRKAVKPPLDLMAIEKAARKLEGYDRMLFNTFRFTGFRLDEANRLQWEDLYLDRGLCRVPGTKTEGSEALRPLPSILIDELRQFAPAVPTGFVFPGRKGVGKGHKVYRRTKLFEKASRLSGVKITAKDLRDYYAAIVGPRVPDTATLMHLLRHKSLTTTTAYTRIVEARMEQAVRDLGKDESPSKTTSHPRKTL